MKSLAVLFIVASLVGVIQAFQSKIIGGQQVAGDAYPFQVSLADTRYMSNDANQRRRQSERTKINSHICGGVLLTKNWIVTAAHCVMNPSQPGTVVPANWLGVGIGSHDLVEMYDKGYVPVSRIIVQPQFDQSRWSNDIALLRLSTPVDRSVFRDGHYAMGCLANNNRLSSPRLWSIGWGNTVPITENGYTHEWTPHQPSRALKQLTVKDVSNNGAPFCQGRSDLVCIHATQQNTGPCRGDSGGALVSSNKRTVVGVYSFMKSVPVNGGNDQAMCLGDGQYTRVSSHIQWIRSHVNERFCTSQA